LRFWDEFYVEVRILSIAALLCWLVFWVLGYTAQLGGVNVTVTPVLVAGFPKRTGRKHVAQGIAAHRPGPYTSRMGTYAEARSELFWRIGSGISPSDEGRSD